MRVGKGNAQWESGRNHALTIPSTGVAKLAVAISWAGGLTLTVEQAAAEAGDEDEDADGSGGGSSSDSRGHQEAASSNGSNGAVPVEHAAGFVAGEEAGMAVSMMALGV